MSALRLLRWYQRLGRRSCRPNRTCDVASTAVMEAMEAQSPRRLEAA
jgi:hypothetical protein